MPLKDLRRGRRAAIALSRRAIASTMNGQASWQRAPPAQPHIDGLPDRMLRLTDLKLPLDHSEAALAAAILARLEIEPAALTGYSVAKRSYDARKRGAILLIYALDVETPREAELLRRHADDPHVQPTPDTAYHFVARAPARVEHRPLVIGFGPCGLFAGLILAQMGFRPIILDRGKVVRERTKDTWGLWRKRNLHPESNVQFGEGGAGTFSDGKLYSQISDPRHHGRKVLTEFVKAGAPEEILHVSKPHIGTFRLVIDGGEHARHDRGAGRRNPFQPARGRSADRHRRGRRAPRARRASWPDGEQLRADHVVLAVGHSARDTFEMLHARGVHLEAEALLDRLPHRASAIVDRPRPLRPAGRASGPRRRRLQAGASLRRTGAAVRSTASACAPAAPWSPRPASPAAWSPTA